VHFRAFTEPKSFEDAFEACQYMVTSDLIGVDDPSDVAKIPTDVARDAGLAYVPLQVEMIGESIAK
jgi:hypothetical protein